MTRLEIVHLRSYGEPLKVLSDRISNSIRTRSDTSELVAVYRRDGLVTDLAVHIQHPEVAQAGGPSRLGLQLASEFRAVGFVEHTLWRELK